MLIGDPLQLRPTVENYRESLPAFPLSGNQAGAIFLELSMDNPRTGRIYRFDQSLMERLATMGMPMSRLDIQRRMRPSISRLIR